MNVFNVLVMEGLCKGIDSELSKSMVYELCDDIDRIFNDIDKGIPHLEGHTATFRGPGHETKQYKKDQGGGWHRIPENKQGAKKDDVTVAEPPPSGRGSNTY